MFVLFGVFVWLVGGCGCFCVGVGCVAVVALCAIGLCGFVGVGWVLCVYCGYKKALVVSGLLVAGFGLPWLVVL